MFLVCYIGPETVMPIASAVSAIVGALLMFGRRLMTLIGRIIRFPFRRRS